MSSGGEDNGICVVAVKIQVGENHVIKDLLVILDCNTPHAFALLPPVHRDLVSSLFVFICKSTDGVEQLRYGIYRAQVFGILCMFFIALIKAAGHQMICTRYPDTGVELVFLVVHSEGLDAAFCVVHYHGASSSRLQQP